MKQLIIAGIIAAVAVVILFGCHKPKPVDYTHWDPVPVEPTPSKTFEPVVFTIYFTPNSDEFDPIYMQEIFLAGETLQQHKDACMNIFGFADFDGQYESNKQLAKSRADWIRESVVASGVDPKFISKVEAREPVILPEGATLEQRQKCRKGEIHVLPCLDVRDSGTEVDPNDPFRFR
jgi:hypothetical protein